MLCAEDRKVCLKRPILSKANAKEFNVVAKTDISKGEVLVELSGVMASDFDEEHSHLSEVTAHDKQRGPKGVGRLLVGPIRFVNHDCKLNNVEVSTM